MYLKDLGEFLRSFEIKPNGTYDIFLGAGCSVAAGIPLGIALIWEFKRKLYCDHFKINEEKFSDFELETNKNEIQKYFDQQVGFPILDSSEEYSFYFEKCYPQSIDRKLFIQSKVREKKPTLGHRCLGALIISEKIKCIWTSNFDELIENGIKIVDIGKSFVVISEDNKNQIGKIENQYLPKLIKLHGDYRYDKLQNISEELQDLDSKLREYFYQHNTSNGLIIVGYDGNDNSIMSVLEKSLNCDNQFPSGLIWCILKGTKLNERVIKIVNRVNEKNKTSGFLEINSFDEFLYDLYTRCNLKYSEIENIAENLFKKRKPFLFQQSNPNTTPIKLNALQIIKYPNTFYSFDTSIEKWSQLKEIILDKSISAALYKNKIFAFCELEEIKKVFGNKILSEISLKDVETKWFDREDSIFKSMLYDLIAHNLINKYGLQCSESKKRKFYLKNKKINKSGLPNYLTIYEALEIRLDHRKKCFWLLLLPTVEILDSRDLSIFSQTGKKLAKLEKQLIINKIISERYNSVADLHLNKWLYFLKQKLNSLVFSLGDFKIEIADKFTFAGYKFNDQNYFFQGLSNEIEPQLSFHIFEKNYQSIHPLKGLDSFGPYDSSFKNDKDLSNVKIALISPRSSFNKIIAQLNSLLQNKRPLTEPDYLIEYQGFSTIYKKYLEIPNNPENKLCVFIEDKDTNGKTHVEFYEMLKRKIDYFDTLRGDFDLLIIYFPVIWQRFRELKNENTYFDLHDSVKIYCAKKNIKVQFIEDKSINYKDQAKVLWWLSLAIYVKSNGIPWKNKIIDPDTAFIGLGYAIRSSQQNRMVIGCSQLFDSFGRGLRFLLQPIERPVYYGKNPFMSREDARRLIIKLREAYFKMDPNLKLNKLVVHKTSHFTHEEIEGIAQATEGIDKVELLQIQQFSPWRGIRLNKVQKEITACNYPILRGTSIQLDDFSFLLWTHGSVMNDELAGINRNYYQGGRGIPIPLIVKRFRGSDSHEVIIKELLNLTKMNWNGCQLYKVLPVTLDFSKILSGMAKQNELLRNIPYDFRFFM